jgi:hypothetical protein
MITLYEKSTGKAVPFAHIIDARDSLKTGFYVEQDPTAKPEPIEKVETAPVKIPTVTDKKSLKSKIIPKKRIIKKPIRKQD